MKHIIFTITMLAAVLLVSCTNLPTTPSPAATSNEAEEADIRALVESFGKKLQTVSLLASDAAQEMQKQYSEFVSPTLLDMWMSDVLNAPGRMVSSPWPDRIEITTLTRESPDKYRITGFVVEITSTEIASGKAANKIPVHMIAERDQGRWLITEYIRD